MVIGDFDPKGFKAHRLRTAVLENSALPVLQAQTCQRQDIIALVCCQNYIICEAYWNDFVFNNGWRAYFGNILLSFIRSPSTPPPAICYVEDKQHLAERQNPERSASSLPAGSECIIHSNYQWPYKPSSVWQTPQCFCKWLCSVEVSTALMSQ